MQLAKVIGTVVSTRKEDALVGYKLLVLEVQDPGGAAPSGERLVAIDTLGAGVTVPWEYYATTAAVLSAYAAAGYHIVAVETSPDAVDLYDWTPAWPICLVFGHEKDGVTGSLVQQIETHVRIPMLGAKRSLNVATAGGVVLYDLLRRRHYAAG